MAGINTLTGFLQTEVNWQASNNLIGIVYSPVSNPGDIRKKYSLGTANSNGASGGVDEFFSFQQTIAGGGAITLDLTQMTNILQQATVNIVRIKGYQIRLLSTTDDNTITAPAAASVLVTNYIDVPAPLDFVSAGSGLSITITTSGGTIASVAIGTAGSGYQPSATFTVTVNQAGGSGGVILVTTSSSGVPTTVATSGAGGSGYANASNLPTTELGKYTIFSGGAHMYFDPLSGGFCAVSSTSKKLKIFNNDAVNTATLEISVFGATT